MWKAERRDLCPGAFKTSILTEKTPEKKGQGYLYPHDFENHYVEQQYLPDSLKNTVYYKPGDNKNEQAFYENLKKRKGQK